MTITKNIGMLLLAVYLIIDGLLGFGLQLGPAIFLLYFVALARRHLYSDRQIADPVPKIDGGASSNANTYRTTRRSVRVGRPDAWVG